MKLVTATTTNEETLTVRLTGQTTFLMKQLLIFGLLLMVFSACLDDDDVCRQGFMEGDSFSLPDGRDVRIVDIDDQLCDCDAVCAWEGQFVLTLQLAGAVQLDTAYFSAYPLRERDTVMLYGFQLAEWDANLVDYCGGEVEEADMCFTIGF